MNWDERFAGEEYLFGTAPARFLEKQVHRLPPGSEVLVVADGEGRNSVWLAELGHTVNAWDSSAVAIEKARRLARTREVDVTFSVQNAAEYPWPKARFDAVIGIFIQFAPPKLRDEMLAGMIRATRPGGLVMLHGYTVEQLKHGTGGLPPRRISTPKRSCEIASPEPTSCISRAMRRTFLKVPRMSDVLR